MRNRKRTVRHKCVLCHKRLRTGKRKVMEVYEGFFRRKKTGKVVFKWYDLSYVHLSCFQKFIHGKYKHPVERYPAMPYHR